jgi:phosphoribosyl-AMP cyclohydrolase
MTDSLEITTRHWLDGVNWNEAGLVAAIVQDAASGEVLMMAWMNRESLARSLEAGEAVYWSRSRSAIWHKGETSGHFQKIREIRLDCDGDTLLLKVEQVGGIACHTGRKRCFFHLLEDGRWVVTEPVVQGSSGNPREIRK